MVRVSLRVAFLATLFTLPVRAADPIPDSDWLPENPKLKLPFEHDTPIVFISRAQNAAEWDKLSTFWNEGTESVLNPRTGQTVTRKVVRIKVPLGLGAPPVPPENPLTLARWILGKRLYFDGLLSSDGTVSCASCHDPKRGFTDQSRFSKGIGGQLGGASAPPVINSCYNALQFWDGRAASLEEQAQGPVQNPVEMTSDNEHAWPKAISRVRRSELYNRLFAQAFGHAPTRDAAAKAIATYERTVLSGNSIVDRADVVMRARVDEDGGPAEPIKKDYLAVLKEAVDKKDTNALDALQLTETSDEALSSAAESLARGRAVFFGKARCNSCHVGENFTDNQFHNLGVETKDGKVPVNARGRFAAQSLGHKNNDLIGAFKTPSLRALLATAPYLHDGSEDTLEKVVEFYDRGGNANEYLDAKMRDFEAETAFLRAIAEGKKPEGEAVTVFAPDGRPVIPLKLKLTAQEKKDLVLYMRGLQGDPIVPIVADPEMFPGTANNAK